MIACRSVSYREIRGLRPIRSFFETGIVYRLHRSEKAGEIVWRLREHVLSTPFRKVYDSGDLDDWLASYEDAGDPAELHYVVAEIAGRVEGLATWKINEWNATTWLIDIRVDSSSRRQGVGRALIETVKSATERQGLRGMSVETQINNFPAIRFYVKHGFEITGFNESLYTNEDMHTQDVAVFLFWPAIRPDGSLTSKR